MTIRFLFYHHKNLEIFLTNFLYYNIPFINQFSLICNEFTKYFGGLNNLRILDEIRIEAICIFLRKQLIVVNMTNKENK